MKESLSSKNHRAYAIIGGRGSALLKHNTLFVERETMKAFRQNAVQAKGRQEYAPKAFRKRRAKSKSKSISGNFPLMN